MIRTEAWVLRSGAPLALEEYCVDEPAADEVLVEPLIGCWEGNMTHAITRRPVDICVQRNEPAVVIGNGGVVRVLRPGAEVRGLREGDICLVFCNGAWDRFGFATRIYAYDAPGTVGLLARRTKLHHRQLIPVPPDSAYTLGQWAAFSLRYVTAWSNWRLAYQSLRALRPPGGDEKVFVWGWGGGATFAELLLARHHGCQTAMSASIDSRLDMIAKHGIDPIDRRAFSGLSFSAERYARDVDYRERYLAAERIFLCLVEEKTRGSGVSIFVDFIGQPVFRASLKALGRPGVITTAGWKEGMQLQSTRALECMNWHIHVHTHFARYPEGLEAVAFAEANGWLPPPEKQIWPWHDISHLGHLHASGQAESLFPLYQVNSV